jgi:phosphoglycolate phosphatase
MKATKNYRHVVWDWNGTLFDDLTYCVAIINDMLAQRGLATVTLDEYRRVFTFPVRDYYREVGFDLDSESFEVLSHEFVAAYESRRHTCTVHAQTRHVLEQVAASGRGQSLLSAYPHAALVPLVRALDLERYFEHLLGLDDIYARSKLEQARKLLHSLEHAPAQVLLVGDTLHDVEVAAEVGADCVLVAHGHQARSRLARSGAPVVDSLDALYAML